MSDSRALRILVALALTVGLGALSSNAWADTGGGTGTSGSPAPADAQSASDAASASVIAATYGHPVVVDSETTETEQVSELPDGSMQLTENAEPVRVQQNGTWVSIDTDLVSAVDGWWAPQASAVPVEFSNGGSGPLARVQAADGSWLSESWPAGPLPMPVISGSTADYGGVFPGVDLELTATSTGMSSVLVVHDATAAANPQLADVQFAVSGTTISPVAGPGGAGSAAAAESSNGLLAASPSWWDSTQPGAGVDGPGGAGDALPVPDAVSASTLTVNAQAAARTPGVTFPVYVDPDWTGGVVNRTFVDSAYPTAKYWNGSGASDTCQHVGYIDAADAYPDYKARVTRSYWTMSLAPVLGKHVTVAHFNTTETWAYSTTATEVDLYLTGTISASTDWDSKPGDVSEIASATVAHGYVPGGNSCPSGDSGTAVGFDATSTVASVVADGHSSITLGLQAASETDPSGWKKFRPNPTLTITAYTPPTTPGGLSVSGCAFVCGSPAYTKDNTPTLTATASDSDKLLLNYTYALYQGQSDTLPPVYQVGKPKNYEPGSQSSWTPAALPPGAYEYRVAADDGVIPGPWSALFKFTVDTSPPGAPTLTESGGLSTNANAPAGTVGVTQETVTIAPAAASDDAYGYAYAIFPSTSSVVFPTNLTCNVTTAGYTTVCPGTVNAPAAVTITAPDDQSTFAAITFDAAGNTVGTSAPSNHVSFYALADSASMSAGHSWVTDTATAACPGGQAGPVPDSATGSAQSLTLGGDTCWGADSTAPSTTGGYGAGVLGFDGTSGQAAATGSGVLDTTKSYTVAAWVSPSQTTAVADAMGQTGNGESAFYLQQNAGAGWQFCVSSTDTAATWGGTCAASSGSLQANQWTFVIGQYNSIDRTVTLRFSNSNGTGLGTPIVTSAPTTVASTFTAGTQIGRAFIYGSYRNWSGNILDPVAVQGIADTAQLQQLMLLTPPSQVNVAGGN